MIDEQSHLSNFVVVFTINVNDYNPMKLIYHKYHIEHIQKYDKRCCTILMIDKQQDMVRLIFKFNRYDIFHTASALK